MFSALEKKLNQFQSLALNIWPALDFELWTWPRQ